MTINKKSKAKAKSNSEKISNFSKFFNKSVKTYKEKTGRLPWQRGWHITDNTPWFNHVNAVNNKVYGYFMNQIILSMSAEENGFTSNKWISKGNIQKNNGTWKGSATWVYGWFFWEEEMKDKDGKTLKDDKGKIKKRSGFNFRTFPVWNVDQCSNLPEKLASEEVETVEYTPLEGRLDIAEEYISNIGAKVEFGKNGAYYKPSMDYIGMPNFEQFKTPENYYSTYVHELVHWTKTKDRCDRADNHKTRKAYAFEELIAEIGAVHVMNNLGIQMDQDAFDNHLAYVDSWLGALDDDTTFLVDACMQAEKAVKFLNSFQDKEELKKVA